MKINRLTTVATVALAVVIMSLGGCKKEEEPAPAPETQVEESAVSDNTEIDAGNDKESEEADPNELPKGQMRSFLSGLPVDEKIGNRRPVAIMLNNLKPAQPMSGVSYADVVYEYVVEGGITRLMGLFENYDGLEKIGSVRSCREYFVYTALEFDAIYCHFGQATPYVGDYLNSDGVDDISGAVSGIERPATNTFYRVSKSCRRNCL